MRKKNRITIEYADAPSKFVTLYNYKDPFMKFEGGYGFQGVLLFDSVEDLIQCHFCGDWFEALPKHLHSIHDMTAYEYKDRVGLLQSTALINEDFREKLIASGMDRRLINLRNRKGITVSQETKDKIRASLKKNAMELKNQHGTCPEQLIDRLRKLIAEWGHVPAHKDIPFEEALMKTFGSVAKAVKLAGYTPRTMGQNIHTRAKKKFSKEELQGILDNFYQEHKRLPMQSDLRRQMLPSADTFKRHFGSWKKTLEAVNK